MAQFIEERDRVYLASRRGNCQDTLDRIELLCISRRCHDVQRWVRTGTVPVEREAPRGRRRPEGAALFIY